MQMCFVEFQEKDKVYSSLKLFGSQNLKTDGFGGPEGCRTQFWKCCSNECSNEFHTTYENHCTCPEKLEIKPYVVLAYVIENICIYQVTPLSGYIH